MFDKLKGYRSYICAAGMAIATFVRAMGWVDEMSYQTIMGLLASGAVAAIRAAK